MAQLRDAQTSELIAEGTPTELVLLADELGVEEVLFDDVGEHFNPDAVRQAHGDQVAGLERAARDAKGNDRKRLTKALEDAKSVAPRARRRVRAATEELEAARRRRDERAG